MVLPTSSHRKKDDLMYPPSGQKQSNNKNLGAVLCSTYCLIIFQTLLVMKESPWLVVLDTLLCMNMRIISSFINMPIFVKAYR